MKFSELTEFMESQGITTLADIARALSTTPQAVSNWKSRGQVPHHVAASINRVIVPKNTIGTSAQVTQYPPFEVAQLKEKNLEEDTFSISDILITIATQLKLIVLVLFITVFITFTYVQFIQVPLYQSKATVLFPTSGNNNLSGIAGLASQFGVNIPSGSQADLSSPALFPELLSSRTFAKKILDNKFNTTKYGKELSLLAILNNGIESPKGEKEKYITLALGPLGKILDFEKDRTSTISVIKVKTFEPIFSRDLAEVVVSELEALNRYFKSQTVNEKTVFIEKRIASVKIDLEKSEQSLKKFNERNRQVTSPALQLDLDRLEREAEIQKGIFLTLKQQLELAKIEEIQEASIVQVLDKPQIPLGSFNKNLRFSVLMAIVLGTALGILLGFFRSYLLNNEDVSERRKIRRVRNYLRKKFNEIFQDPRISSTVSIILILGAPFYFGHKSEEPVFFGMYSVKMFIVNIAYIIALISAISIFVVIRLKKNKQ